MTADILAVIPNLRAFAVSLCAISIRRRSRSGNLGEGVEQARLLRRGTNLRAGCSRSCATYIIPNIANDGGRSGFGWSHRREACDRAAQNSHMDMLDFRAALQELPADQREALILIGASAFPMRRRLESAAAPSEP